MERMRLKKEEREGETQFIYAYIIILICVISLLQFNEIWMVERLNDFILSILVSFILENPFNRYSLICVIHRCLL